MNPRFYYIPAFITLGLGVLSGCGGSGSNEQAYLPVGLQRTLDITLSDNRPYVFSFVIESNINATIYTATSEHPTTASIHPVNYNPSSDSAEQIGFFWSSTDGKQAFVILKNPKNICTGLGSAVCSVKDAAYPSTTTQQDNCEAIIREFRMPSSSDQ